MLEHEPVTGVCDRPAFQGELLAEWRTAEHFKLPLAILRVARADGLLPDACWWDALVGLAGTPGAVVGLAPGGSHGWVLLPATWTEAARAHPVGCWGPRRPSPTPA